MEYPKRSLSKVPINKSQITKSSDDIKRTGRRGKKVVKYFFISLGLSMVGFINTEYDERFADENQCEGKTNC